MKKKSTQQQQKNNRSRSRETTATVNMEETAQHTTMEKTKESLANSYKQHRKQRSGVVFMKDNDDAQNGNTKKLKRASSGQSSQKDHIPSTRKRHGSAQGRITNVLRRLKKRKIGTATTPTVTKDATYDIKEIHTACAPPCRVNSVSSWCEGEVEGAFLHTDVQTNCSVDTSDLSTRMCNGVHKAAEKESVLQSIVMCRPKEVVGLLAQSEHAETVLALPWITEQRLLLTNGNRDRTVAIPSGVHGDLFVGEKILASTCKRAALEAAHILVLRGQERQTETPIIAHHVCQRDCVYTRAVEWVGINGCGSVSIAVEQRYGADIADRVDARDIWVCTKSGEIHVCTAEFCDAKLPERDGSIQCEKTSMRYGTVAIPASNTYTSSGCHPSSAIVAMNDNAVAMASATATTCHTKEWRAPKRKTCIAHKNGDASLSTTKSTLRRRRPRPGNVGVVTAQASSVSSQSISIAGKVIATRAAVTGVTHATSISHNNEGEEFCSGVVFLQDAPLAQQCGQTVCDVLAHNAAQMRRETLSTLFSRWVTSGDVAAGSSCDFEAAYLYIIQYTATVIATLPEVIDGKLAITSDLASVHVDKYAQVAWNCWTLVSWYTHVVTSPGLTISSATASQQLIVAPTTIPCYKKQTDITTRLRQVVLGALYQHRYGFFVRSMLEQVPGFRGNEHIVLSALSAVLCDSEEEEEEEEEEEDNTTVGAQLSIDQFREAGKMQFLTQDNYLQQRLVEESRITSCGKFIDGLRLEGSPVNDGLTIVRECFSGIAYWSLTLLVGDIIRGVDPHIAYGDHETRIELAFVG